MNLFDNLYRSLHDNNRPFMNFIFNHSQYKHECEIEQQKEDAQILSPSKTHDRHGDTSLLGSVRRRLIAPKLRAQHSLTPPPPTAIIVSTSPSTNTNDLKSKTRSMTIDLKKSSSKESVAAHGNNGNMASVFASTKVTSLIIYLFSHISSVGLLIFY